MCGKYALYVRETDDENLIISNDRMFFNKITLKFLSKEINYKEYEKFIIDRLSLINIEYSGYNLKEIKELDKYNIMKCILNCIKLSDNCVEDCFFISSYFAHLQVFDDNNYKTAYRLLDMLLNYSGYKLDIHTLFNSNEKKIEYFLPIIYEINDSIQIDQNWFLLIKH